MEYQVSFTDSNEQFIEWLNNLGSEQIRSILYTKYMSSQNSLIRASVANKPSGSANKGKAAEANIHHLLSQHFNVSYSGGTAKSGDLMVTHSGKCILVEIKDHKCAVKTTEITKFDRDIDANEGIHAAMFISLNSPIVKQSTVEFTVRPIPRLMLAMPSDDTIIAMMRFLVNVASEVVPAVTIDAIIDRLNIITIVRNNIRNLRAHNEKVLNDEALRLQTYENNMYKLIADQPHLQTITTPEVVSQVTTCSTPESNLETIKKVLFTTMNKKFYVKDIANYEVVNKLISHINFGENTLIKGAYMSERSYKIRFLNAKTVFETTVSEGTVISQNLLLANMAKLDKNKLTCPISDNTYDFITSIVTAIESAHI